MHGELAYLVTQSDDEYDPTGVTIASPASAVADNELRCRIASEASLRTLGPLPDNDASS